MQCEDLRAIVRRIWKTTFDLVPDAVDYQPSAISSSLIGWVEIGGAWQGAVALRCSRQLAMRLAREMLSMAEPSQEAIRDALGELTNLTAGAAQRLLPEPCELTPPQVIEGNGPELPVPARTMLAEVHFQLRTEPMTVIVLEAASAPSPQASGPYKAREQWGGQVNPPFGMQAHWMGKTPRW